MAKLTAAAVSKLKPGAERRVIKDDQARALYLIIYPSGERSWVMRFRSHSGAPRKLTLGSFDEANRPPHSAPAIGGALTLAEARRLATGMLNDHLAGVDVFARHQKASRLRHLRTQNAQAQVHAFGPLARQFIDEHARARTRRWRATARVLGLIYPLDGGSPTETKDGLAQDWANTPVTQIGADEIFAVVETAKRRGIPGTKPRTKGLSDARARHMLQALSTFCTWLLKQRIIRTDPCRDVQAPPPGAERERKLSVDEIRWLWLACDKVGPPFGPAVKLLLLTGQRRNEVGGLLRSELGADGLWTLPGTRTKNKRPHLVPLAPLALKVIASVPVVEGCPYVFSTTGNTPISGWSKAKQAIDREMRVLAQKEKQTFTPWVLHDLRRTAVTDMGEIGVQPHVIEVIINHISGHRGGVAGIYNRSELLPERRAGLARWAAHVERIVSGKKASNVVPLRAKRKRS